MHRRSFCVATAFTGAACAVNSLHSSALGLEAKFSGQVKADIPTPALLVDLDSLESNIQKMAGHCRQAKIALRPHAKTHKCPAIAKLQVAAGAVGICAATVPEAEALAAAGIGDILLTSPIVDAGKIGRMIALASAGGRRIMLSVGHAREVELLSQAAESANARIDVLVDLDVGDKRTGGLPGEPAVELAKLIGRSKQLVVRGVQAYAGFASHTNGFENRKRVSREAIGRAFDTLQLLRKAGFDAEVLSGGSTGTYNIDSDAHGVTELQAGSYVFMDVNYRAIGSRDGGTVYSDFRPSLTVLATVVSSTYAGRVTIDAGTKALDTTTTSLPQVKDSPGILYAKAGDEFGALTSDAANDLPTIGQRVELLVPHCDPSVNLYSHIYACRGDKIEAIWPVAARREHG